MSLFRILWGRQRRYKRLADLSDSESSDVHGAHQSAPQYHKKTRIGALGSAITISVATLLVILSTVLYLSVTKNGTHKPEQPDSIPPARREWRTLTREEKLHYISAIQCLRHKPSRIGRDQSLYDDFPWVHSQLGRNIHDSAAFLAWHRYFISVYELALQQDCGYEGLLPYWDWTLDWESPTEAPVWHNTLGFGGTGTTTTSNFSLLGGHCVTDGPFADLQVLYIKGELAKHCLTRGFLDPSSTEMGVLSQWLNPTTVWEILNDSDYATFNLHLERNSHNSIPRIVRGDFAMFTAPYDPVFYLHHAQLDRIWFIWQHLGAGRLDQYTGLTSPNGTVQASPQDLLLMGGLAPDISVSEILDTTGEKLSYIYI